MPDFAKHYAGNGYTFGVDDIVSLAILVENEVGPLEKRSTGKRFHLRGKEWDVSCETAAELTTHDMPNTITRVAFSLYSEKGYIRLELRGDNLSPSVFEGATLDVSGSDLNWVSGAFDRVKNKLAACRTSWGWVHTWPGAITGWIILFVAYGLAAQAVFGRSVRSKEVASGLTSLPVMFSVLTVWMAFCLYPNVEFHTAAAKDRRAWRAALWAVILGLGGNAIWAMVAALAR